MVKETLRQAGIQTEVKRGGNTENKKIKAQTPCDSCNMHR